MTTSFPVPKFTAIDITIGPLGLVILWTFARIRTTDTNEPNCGRGGRIRTYKSGFGDQQFAVSLRPYELTHLVAGAGLEPATGGL